MKQAKPYFANPIFSARFRRFPAIFRADFLGASDSCRFEKASIRAPVGRAIDTRTA
jgi:hypothetical protein